jgi:LysR family transcriptional regulator of gallate degradation
MFGVTDLPAMAQFHKLRAFAAVARHGNVHRAGEAIHLSQPAVTRAVRHLEGTLGASLFERTTKGMHLTIAGQCAFRRTERAIEELRVASSEMLKLADAPRCPSTLRERLPETVTEAMLVSLIAIAGCGSEGAAAALMQLSQPALNRNLHQLEHLAGLPLFARSARGTRLTGAGEVLVRHAKLAIAELRVAGEELASLKGRLEGKLVVGALPLSSGRLVPLATERTLRHHPGLRISIVDGTYDTLSHGLRCADINLIVGALRSSHDEPHSIHEPLFEDTLSVVAGVDHPVLKQKRTLTLHELRDQSWIVPLADTPARVAFERAFRAESAEPPQAQLEVNSPSIVRALLLSGERLALVSPRQIQQELRQGILAVLPVEVTRSRRTIGIARLRNSQPSPGMVVLMDALREISLEDRNVS